MKLAILGGKKTRSKKMPPRFSFGVKENSEIKKMLKYYKSRGEDPKYSGLWEKNFVINFQILWVVDIQMQLLQAQVQFM